MEAPVLTRISGGIGYITLNRPKALHALNLDMCQIIYAALRAWAVDPAVALVVIDHAPDTRGFCAGGDIAMLRESGLKDGQAARAFFAQEYRLNVAIHDFPKPYLAIMDGITMGGGVGLSVHGSYRIATDKTVFAMPETGIGLFPDVGGGWFLPRLRGELGTWLALTGARLKGHDVAAAGIATHYLPSELVSNLKAQLAEADFSIGAAEMLGEVLRRLTHSVPPGSFEPHRVVLDRCFKFDRVEEIVAALRAEAGDWAAEQLDILATKSPETMKLALRQLREGRAAADFRSHMQMEYRIGWRKVQSADFIEGVRAVILDKDHAPKWAPPELEQVDDAQIARYFEPLGEAELTFDAA